MTGLANGLAMPSLIHYFILLLVIIAGSAQARPMLTIENSLGINESSRHWETNWLMYGISILGITTTAFTLVGCLCCRRKRPKGFQEFKDGSSYENDGSLPQLQGLELQVPVTTTNTTERVQFEPLPVERIVPESLAGAVSSSPRPKPPAPTPSIVIMHDDAESESDVSTLKDSCYEWFQKTDLHVPRDRLKYLREIGHGWFGKVVEGCADLQGIHLNKSVSGKSVNVVVRILTEEATAKEKAWFLGEATPYFKLRHRNILSLFGSCLESDPYLLLFESCPLGDLKGFLKANRDLQTRQTLINENMPTRIAIEVGAALRHMHEHKLAHTDLAARNCLVAPDLSIKLGDYGTGVEKYPSDYYVLGDRALPIRWSAPETIECTDTTIETREITPRANIWSYAVLLWEIAHWGDRPYDDLEDEKVIEALLSPRSIDDKLTSARMLLDSCQDCATNLVEAIDACLVLEPDKRLPLEKVRHVLLRDQLESESSDFEQRWETLRPNVQHQPLQQQRSASLQNLRGSLDSENWPSFRLGPDEPVKNVPRTLRLPFRESDSETEEESWRGRVERGAYTEKVKQKSKSVADLMVLVHIEPDSDADLSLGPQVSFSEKIKKRLPATGSDGDLSSAVFDDQFDAALRKLRDPLIGGNSLKGPRSLTPADRPKLLTLTTDHGQTPILRLTIDSTAQNTVKEMSIEKSAVQSLHKEPALNVQSPREHLLKLFPTANPSQSLLRYETELTSSEKGSNVEDAQMAVIAQNEEEDEAPHLAKNILVTDLDEESEGEQTVVLNEPDIKEDDIADVNSWNSALDTVLEQKNTSDETFVETSSVCKNETAHDDAITPSPQSRAEYSAEDVEDEFSNAEDLPGLSKRQLPMDEEDDRKRMSTPDDERSSDSGFRDKESCEEEESPLPGPLPKLASISQPDSAEEEQLRILFELDTILDAECYSALGESLEQQQNIDKSNVSQDQVSTNSNLQKDAEPETESSDTTAQTSSETTGITEREVIKSASDDTNVSCRVLLDSRSILDSESMATTSAPSSDDVNNLNNPDDEDSSTMSLRSDNSYVSFAMDEEFVTAIRNELREKLPQAQTNIVEVQEPHDEDDPPLVSDLDSKNWDDEVAEHDLGESSGSIDISIRYNTYGTPLSPILEERESSGNSDSTNLTRDESQDVSTASKNDSNSMSEDDVLFIDTQTNQATIVEGVSHDIEMSASQMTPQHHQRFGGIITRMGTGAPMPSPEDENNVWQSQQQHHLTGLPPQLEDNLMSTSFASETWDSDEEVPSESVTNDVENDEEDEDEGEDVPLDEEDDEEEDENSSSSGEFVWQQYGTMHPESHETDSPSAKKVSRQNTEDAENDDVDEDFDSEEEDEEEEEFTPSAWDATLAPHRSALRSPDKSLKKGDRKKSVCFKKQRYHCIYEYPKETPPMETTPAIPSWEATSYTDWEEMIDNMDRLNFQPMDYFESSNSRTGRDEEFIKPFGSNRPFQFQSDNNSKYTSQFFPGASSSNHDNKPVHEQQQQQQQQQSDESAFCSDRQQLGELRHTRDRLTLNLSSANGNNRILPMCNPIRHRAFFDEDDEDEENGNELAKTEQQLPISEAPVIQPPPVKSSPSDGTASITAGIDSHISRNRDDLHVD